MNKYNRLLTIFLLVTIGCLYADAASSSNPKTPVRTIKIVMDNNYPPYVFLDGKGNLQGILIDHWQLWEQKTGIKVDIAGMDWSEAQRRMEAGEFDVIDTIFFNERRARIYDFSKPYAKLDVSIFFHKDISGISSADSLQGFPVAVKSGDNAIDHLRGKGISLFQEYPSYEAIIRAAKEHKVVVAVIDNPPALYFLYKAGIMDQFRHSAPLYTGEFHRAVRKGNSTILKTVEEGFTQISESEYQDIDRRWFGTEAKAFHPYLRFIVIGLGALIFIVLLLVVWNRTLRKKVYERTLRLEEEIALNTKKAEALQKSEEKYHALLDSASDAILIADFEGNLLDVNKKAEELLGYTREELLGMNIEQIHPKEELEKIIKSFRGMAEGRLSSSSDTKVLKKDGTSVLVDITGNAIEYAGGRVVQGIFRDITKRKQAELLLKESEERYRVLVEYSNDGVALVEGDRHIYVNQKFLDMFGYNKHEDIIGKSPFMIVHPDDLEMVLEHNRKRQMGEPVPPKYEFRGMRKDGTIIYIEVSAAKITYSGKPVSLVYLRDMTERKHLEQQLHTMSFTDELTGLYNRRGFITLSEQQLRVAERTKKDMLLFFVDLDKMKQINDTLGHQEGDKALIEITTILKVVFRESDIVGRIGGDEFAILAIDTTDETRDVLIMRLYNTLDNCNRPEGRNYQLSLSIGIAHYDPETPSTLDKLMAQADILMYEEKRNKQY